MGKYRTNLQKSSDLLFTRNAQYHKQSKARKKRHFILSIYVLGFALIYSANLFSSSAAQDISSRNPSSVLNAPEEVGAIYLHIPSIHFDELFLNCTRPSIYDFPSDLFTGNQRENGAIAIHFIVSFYIFYALLLVCDEYFVPSIESICHELRVPSDIAGATFMAISTSAPELFTNVVGTFVTKGDIGLGTIVGSAVFNILAVGACCGIGAGIARHKMKGPDGRIGIPLEWYPLTRDCIFYLLSVALLVCTLMNGRIYWSEAMAMIALYLLYILAMCYNGRLKKFSEALVSRVKGLSSSVKDNNEKNENNNCRKISIVIEKIVSNEKTPLLLTQNEKGQFSRARIDGNSDSSGSGGNLREYELSSEALDEVLITNALIQSNTYKKHKEEPWTICSYPNDEDWKIHLEWLLSWPIRLIFTLTIPDCRRYRFKKWYPATLIACVVWIALLSYIVNWMMTIIGHTLGIPDSVTGLTFLAAGTSIPEVISSIIVARQGLGSMALSNSIGSNTFDVLFCLGFPWLIQTLIMANEEVNYIEIHSGGLEYSALLLIASLVALYLVIAANGFLLDRKVGIISLVMYIIFVTLACLLEMNVFFEVNLPPCKL